MDVLDKLFRAGLLVAGGFGRLGSSGIDCSLVVEAVQVAASLLKVLDPLLRLLEPVSRAFLVRTPVSDASTFLSSPYLGDHHVAVEGALSVGFSGPLDVRTDLSDDGSAEGNVGHEVAVHDVDVQPVCSMADGV